MLWSYNETGLNSYSTALFDTVNPYNTKLFNDTETDGNLGQSITKYSTSLYNLS